MPGFSSIVVFPLSVNFTDRTYTFYSYLRPVLFLERIIGICFIRKITVKDVFQLEQHPTFIAIVTFILRLVICAFGILNLFFVKFSMEECLDIVSIVVSTVICLSTEKCLIEVILKLESNTFGDKTKSLFYIRCSAVCFVIFTQMYSFLYEIPPGFRISEFVCFLCELLHRLTCIVIILEVNPILWEVKNQIRRLSEGLKQHKLISEIKIEGARAQYELIASIIDDINYVIGMRMLVPALFPPIMLLIRFYNLLNNQLQMPFLYCSTLLVYIITIHSIASLGSAIKKEVYTICS